MSKKLKIECFDEKHQPFIKIVAIHLDVTNKQTIISTSSRLTENDIIRFFSEIDHWNIMDGMITIYYKNGFEMEITRIND